MEVFRTPEERFSSLPGFELDPHYREVGPLRLAHVEDGAGPPVLFLHGQPTWSFLWRRVIPPIRAAGYRCIAPDLVGFGRSDKPADPAWYTYDRHVELAATLLEDLDLREVTLVVHDWGGPIGLRLAVEQPGRIARMAIMDTGLFTGTERMSDAFLAIRQFVETTEDLPIGKLVRGGFKRDLGDEVIAAYDAPFPTPASKSGARAFPLLLPMTPDAPGAAVGRQVLNALAQDDRPKLLLWADSDPVIPPSAGEAFAKVLRTDPPVLIRDASHFLQEDAGEQVGHLIADWLE